MPGAQANAVTEGSCAIARTNACSRAPDPITRTRTADEPRRSPRTPSHEPRDPPARRQACHPRPALSMAGAGSASGQRSSSTWAGGTPTWPARSAPTTGPYATGGRWPASDRRSGCSRTPTPAAPRSTAAQRRRPTPGGRGYGQSGCGRPARNALRRCSGRCVRRPQPSRVGGHDRQPDRVSRMLGVPNDASRPPPIVEGRRTRPGRSGGVSIRRSFNPWPLGYRSRLHAHQFGFYRSPH